MASFVQELKRRNVFKVGAAYAVVAWILIQVSGEVLPTFEAPDWVQQTLTFLFFLGFPITLVMAWAYEMTPAGIRLDDGVSTTQTVTNSTDRKLIYVVLGMVTLLGGFQISDRLDTEDQVNTVISSSPNEVATTSNTLLSRRSRIDLGATVPRAGPNTRATIAMASDGSRLAYSLRRPSGEDLTYMLELDQLEPRLLSLEPGGDLFFSPDGEWLAFSQQGLHRISVRGGPPQQLAGSMRAGANGFWSSDDTLFYTSSEEDGRQLMRLSANGGVPEILAVPRDASVISHSHPHLLPNGDSLLFTTVPNNGAREGQVALVTLSTGEVKTLIQGGYSARYVPTGHLVFMRSAALWAVAFDLDSLETTGPEVPVIQGVETEGSRGSAAYAFSNDGLLVYLPGTDTTALEGAFRTLTWVDREGDEEDLAQTRDFRVPVISPDGQRLATVVRENSNDDIWIYELTRGILSRLTSGSESDYYPLWSPDGERIVFSSTLGSGGLWWQSADGTGQAEALVTGVPGAIPYSFTPDGAQLVYAAGGDLHILDMDGSSPPRPLIASMFIETRAAISPDGRWIAYESNQTGEFEIYVQPFPDVDGGRWQISNQGGVWPKWHSNGQELFFRFGGTGNTTLWSAQVEAEGDSLRPGVAIPVIASANYRGTGTGGGFDISNADSRFLFIKGPETEQGESAFEAQTAQLVVVDNWFEELRRRAPTGQ